MRSNHELMQLNVDQDWIIHGVLPVGGLWMIAGAPKAGKSLLVAEVCHAIVNTTEHFMHGLKVVMHGRVLYVNLDMGVVTHRRRFLNLQQEHSYNFNNLYHITRDETPASFNVLNESTKEWLAAQIRDLKPLVIVFDVIRRFYSGDENSSSVAQDFINAITDLMAEGDSAAILVHHTNKTSEISKNMGLEKNPIDAVRGSSTIAGSVDTVTAFNDNASALWYQGRDITLKYNVKKGICGIPNRWISKTTPKRGDQIERLLAGFIHQKPGMDSTDYFNLCLPHVDEFTKDDFKALYAKVKTNAGGYEFV
jgi:KaiC/GvpD/RAD55 family RecA-like ATPase